MTDQNGRKRCSCVRLGNACSNDAQCCEGGCLDRTCQVTATACVRLNGACTSDDAFCTGFCADDAVCRPFGSCAEKRGECYNPDDETLAEHDARCCSGVCNYDAAGPSGDMCVTCRSVRAECDPAAASPCCAGLICPAKGEYPQDATCCAANGDDPALVPNGEPCPGTGANFCCSYTCLGTVGGPDNS